MERRVPIFGKNLQVDQLRSDPAQASRSARDVFGEARRLVQGITNGSFSTSICR
jgi:hypothetical protein